MAKISNCRGEKSRVSDPTIGILGGMGPASGLYFAQKLIELNKHARSDADHARFVLYSLPNTPSRNDAYLYATPSPALTISQAAEKLATLGATVGVIICNTAHIYFEEIARNTRLPLIHMVDTAVEYIASMPPAKIGLLATTATVRSGIYASRLRDIGRTLHVPNDEDQALLSQVIFNERFGIKATGMVPSADARTTIETVAEHMRDQAGVDCLLVGCTELSMTLPVARWNGLDIIDPVSLLAKKCLRSAGFLVSAG